MSQAGNLIQVGPVSIGLTKTERYLKYVSDLLADNSLTTSERGTCFAEMTKLFIKGIYLCLEAVSKQNKNWSLAKNSSKLIQIFGSIREAIVHWYLHQENTFNWKTLVEISTWAEEIKKLFISLQNNEIAKIEESCTAVYYLCGKVRSIVEGFRLLSFEDLDQLRKGIGQKGIGAMS